MTQINDARIPEVHTIKSGCTGCRNDAATPIELAFAFQPIVDVTAGRAYAHEALVRGPNGESAGSVLAQVDESNRYHFDQRCRTTAITQAAALKMESLLSINFMPNAVYRPEACIRSTLEAAEKHGFPIERIIFETVEGENIISRPHLVEIFRAYKRFGFQTAIDDFGAGYSGLTLLADFQPDLIKLDMELVRRIDTDFVRQRIVCGVLAMCRDLGIRVIAEGIETSAERDFFAANGVALMQGYFFAKPAFKAVPDMSEAAFSV
ncbi:EAL domain-containing protein [Caballeronia humi]|uniref:Diguanylate cyclase/phosphodiesterase with PAS/PAC and GAF sensor(S) n=1 Tax=Caballeronia humi TaxID=326474 RepID=A0A158JGS9_9BURK|nr:EAL domain-containing protein [Caballeronia humi]SAL67550.1 diguanylate cyclase/phosphodiesterase with PAS/PAC and GAF sensor(s) [Caballeronia humi]